MSFLVFAGVSIAVGKYSEITYYDEVVVNYFDPLRIGYLVNFALFITNFGIKYVFYILYAFLLILWGFKKIKTAAFLLLATGGGLYLDLFFKSVFCRPRPVIENPVISVATYGFPSGHAIVSACFYGALIYLTFKYIKNIRLKVLIISSLCILILLIDISRVYLGVHYPSDVIAGMSLGIFWLSLCVLLYKKLTRTDNF